MKSVKDLQRGAFSLSPSLTSVKPLTDKEFQELQVKEYNESKGNLEGYDCPMCKNKGFLKDLVYDPIYEEYRPITVKCCCWQKREYIAKAKASGLGAYLDKSFKDFIDTETWQKSIKGLVIEYCTQFMGYETNKPWLAILGQCGSGKTTLACIVANYLLSAKGYDTMYLIWTDFIGKLKRDVVAGTDVTETLEKVKNVEVLLIDELLKRYNDADLKYIVEIINYRYTKNLVTIITSEKVMKKLLEIDEATFSRVVEKCEGFLINIEKDPSKNYRLKRGVNF